MILPKILTWWRRKARNRAVVDQVNAKLRRDRERSEAERTLRRERGELRQTAQIVGSGSRRLVAMANAMAIMREER